jgi:hypothetical protein
MMSVEEARTSIQKAIDDPLITPVKKRRLFSLYQNLRMVTALTPEVERLIISLCK